MSITDLIPVQYRLLAVGVVVVALMVLAAAGAWQWQGNSYERQLAERDRLHTDTLAEISRAAAAQERSEHAKLRQLEGELKADSETAYKELTDVQKANARLRDRLATADLRLSVILDAGTASAYCGMPTATGAGSVVHGTPRAHLDPAHAQRIVGITDDGDQGLIALRACQAYAGKVSAKR